MGKEPVWCAIKIDGELAKRLSEHCRDRGICPWCRGNDRDMPCLYPSEGKPGCLRDARLKKS